MNLTNLMLNDVQDIALPVNFCELLNELNTTYIIWSEQSSALSAVLRNYLIFISPIMQYDSVVQLPPISSAVLVLIYHNFSIEPIFLQYPNPSSKILLVTHDLAVTKIAAEYDNWNGTIHLHQYRQSRFVWFHLHSGRLSFFTFSQSDYDLIEINKRDAIDLLQEQPRLTQIPNFNGKHIAITIMNSSVFSYLKPEPDGTWTIDGFQTRQLLEACKILNLTPVYQSATSFGDMFLNGTTTPGLLKDVVEQETDVIVGGVFLRAAMMGLLKTSYPWKTVCLRYLVPRPTLLNSSSRVLLNVFSTHLWLVVVGIICMTSITASFIAKISGKPEQSRYVSPWYSVWSLVFHLLQIKYPTRAEYCGSMMPLLLTWSWLGFLLTTVYNSELAATFTNPFYSEKIQTEDQFIQHKYTWGSISNTDIDVIFDLNNPSTKKWATEFFIKERPGDREKRLRRGKYVIVGYSYGNIFYYRENIDDIPSDEVIMGYMIADHCALPKLSAVIFSPGSPFVDAVNLIYRRLISGGILQRDEYELMMSNPRLKQFVPKNVFFSNKELSIALAFSPLPLSVFAEAYFLLIISFGITIIIFITFEIDLIKTIKKKLRNKILFYSQKNKITRIPTKYTSKFEYLE